MKQFILTILSLVGFTFASAKTVEIDGFSYTLSESNTAIVNGLSVANIEASSISIPSTVEYESETYIVTDIKNYAFSYNQNLVNVTLGDSIRQIGNYAFENCRLLSRIHLSKNLQTIGTSAFEQCVRLDSLVLHENIKELNASCFRRCSKLKDIYCLATTSPTFYGYNHFTTFGTLHVLKGYKAAYTDTRWDYFYSVTDDIDSTDDQGNDNPTGNDDDNTDDPTSSILEVEVNKQCKIYSLTGCPMNTTVKGINIIGGKKYVVK